MIKEDMQGTYNDEFNEHKNEITRLEIRIKELENNVKILNHKIKYKKCPRCYGEGTITTPSKEFDYICNCCNGSGEIERRD